MKPNLLDYLKENNVYLDGGMGTLLQNAGLAPGELPERWNISKSEAVRAVHRAYFDAGSNIVNTNTFGANSLKFSHGELEEIIAAAIKNARLAAEESSGSQPKWIALDIGPTGKMLKPYGDLDFEDAVKLFAEVVRLGVKHGADLVFIETMSDSYETRAAVIAAKENSALPIFVSCAFGEDGKLMTGASPAVMVTMLEGLGADAIGANCSLGPEALLGIIEDYLSLASVPVILKPNAGLPRSENGKTVYDVSPADFSHAIRGLMEKGVRIVGGCCGTTPEYISELTTLTKNLKPLPVKDKNSTYVCSYSRAVEFSDIPVLIGERINPTGKKRFKEALRANDVDYILKEAISEEESGAHVLDVNVGLPEINEVEMLKRAICEIQAICPLPLQIDTANPEAMEAALRVYNGKAMINSVNGKYESMSAVFPIAKKYGGLVVALTLDENGIPAKAEGRVEIAKRIISEAEKYGIPKKNLIFDPLALTVSADSSAAKETLRAIKMLSALGLRTSLGVSNVSFGLPARDLINSTFFSLALASGLSAAIMNPHSLPMMQSYHAYLALAGLDKNCSDFVSFAEKYSQEPATVNTSANKAGYADTCVESELKQAIIKGLKDSASEITKTLLTQLPAIQIIEEEIIPALDKVGTAFENKTVYLPGLLMSAEAAKAAFEQIKERMSDAKGGKCRIVIATVKGDIHDIGKNIVKLLLENFGFEVCDLGHDVPPERVAEAAISENASIVALSALMTTTVPAMEQTVKLIHQKLPECKVAVGGAVLTQEYADMIGADFYGKDAMEMVRYAEQINSSFK